MNAGANNSHRLLAIGLSFLVNAALFVTLARLVSTSSRQTETYLAVELQSVSVVHIPLAVPKQEMKAKPAVIKKAIIPASSSGGNRQDHPPVVKILATRMEYRPGGTESPTTSGGGTSAVGPGAPSGSGNGDGTTSIGSSEMRGDSPDAGRGSGDNRGGYEGTAPAPPAPKGESRSAKAISQPKPAYPHDARDEEVEGTTVLLAVIGTDGQVSKTKVERSSGDRRLDKAAENAVKQWTYNPCLKDGTAVESTVRINVHFRLE